MRFSIKCFLCFLTDYTFIFYLLRDHIPVDPKVRLPAAPATKDLLDLVHYGWWTFLFHQNHEQPAPLTIQRRIADVIFKLSNSLAGVLLKKRKKSKE